MNSKVGSLEEKVKLPPTETISRCYQPQQGNRKVIRILTVAVYVLCVSLAAIMLSLYYIFIWDPTIRPFVTKGNNCEKIVIPEKIAIRLLNSSEVTAEQFYKHILEQYRILNQLQLQRQQFLQKQHIQLQQLAAANRFQEIFATATIIQSNPNDPIKKPITPTNGTFLLSQPRPVSVIDIDPAHVPILDTAPAHIAKRKQHRKHYSHHRRAQKSHKKMPNISTLGRSATATGAAASVATLPPSLSPSQLSGIKQELLPPETPQLFAETPLNQPSTGIKQDPLVYTSMPIPLILNPNSDEDTQHPAHHMHAHAHAHGERRSGAQTRKRTTSATVSGYDAQTYLNPFLTGELIFEK